MTTSETIQASDLIAKVLKTYKPTTDYLVNRDRIAALEKLSIPELVKMLTETMYRGFLIKKVFTFTNGRADYEIFPDSGNEEGVIFPYATLEEAKKFIDEKIENQ